MTKPMSAIARANAKSLTLRAIPAELWDAVKARRWADAKATNFMPSYVDLVLDLLRQYAEGLVEFQAELPGQRRRGETIDARKMR